MMVIDQAEPKRPSERAIVEALTPQRDGHRHARQRLHDDRQAHDREEHAVEGVPTLK